MTFVCCQKILDIFSQQHGLKILMPMMTRYFSVFFSTYIFYFCICFIKGAPVPASNRRRRAWSQSDDDEPSDRRPVEGENSPALHFSDGEAGENENVDGDEDE